MDWVSKVSLVGACLMSKCLGEFGRAEDASMVGHYLGFSSHLGSRHWELRGVFCFDVTSSSELSSSSLVIAADLSLVMPSTICYFAFSIGIFLHACQYNFFGARFCPKFGSRPYEGCRALLGFSLYLRINRSGPSHLISPFVLISSWTNASVWISLSWMIFYCRTHRVRVSWSIRKKEWYATAGTLHGLWIDDICLIQR